MLIVDEADSWFFHILQEFGKIQHLKNAICVKMKN